MYSSDAVMGSTAALPPHPGGQRPPLSGSPTSTHLSNDASSQSPSQRRYPLPRAALAHAATHPPVGTPLTTALLAVRTTVGKSRLVLLRLLAASRPERLDGVLVRWRAEAASDALRRFSPVAAEGAMARTFSRASSSAVGDGGSGGGGRGARVGMSKAELFIRDALSVAGDDDEEDGEDVNAGGDSSVMIGLSGGGGGGRRLRRARSTCPRCPEA
eukprot:TRINITY_DN14228_c0_g1_i1.p1 TRINITY_DN14228_c0_g1~~TRINITY_DN14228_c0_g1_i1.p1  ORF type:complete len:215 (+),score=40.83 TRINITY_DN14228_c0_g1_i1:65-709(+)